MPDTQSLFPMLILDASSRRVWVGLKLQEDQLDFAAGADEASHALFVLTRAILERNHVSLAEIKAIAYNEGPGSMLGIRTTVMAIRAWISAQTKPRYQLRAYNSLALSAKLALLEPNAPKAFGVAIDARRDTWNVLERSASGAFSEIALMANRELEQSSQTWFAPASFPKWTTTSATLSELAWEPEKVFASAPCLDLLHTVEIAAPRATRASDFKKWTPQIHGASPA